MILYTLCCLAASQTFTFEIHEGDEETHHGGEATEAEQEEGGGGEEAEVQHSCESPLYCFGTQGALRCLLLQYIVKRGQTCHCHCVL